MLQDEYVKAYYEALLKKQQELESAEKQQESSNSPTSNGLPEMSSNRQVGMKVKRDEDEGDDDVDWEEAPVTGNYTTYQVKLKIYIEYYNFYIRRYSLQFNFKIFLTFSIPLELLSHKSKYHRSYEDNY